MVVGLVVHECILKHEQDVSLEVNVIPDGLEREYVTHTHTHSHTHTHTHTHTLIHTPHTQCFS